MEPSSGDRQRIEIDGIPAKLEQAELERVFLAGLEEDSLGPDEADERFAGRSESVSGEDYMDVPGSGEDLSDEE
jgi:hypothetical protein